MDAAAPGRRGGSRSSTSPWRVPRLPSWRTSSPAVAALLLVVLDRLGAPRLGLVGVHAELTPRPALAQQVPAAVERHADLVQPHPVARLEVAAALLLVQAVLLGDELVDPAQNVAVLHDGRSSS